MDWLVAEAHAKKGFVLSTSDKNLEFFTVTGYVDFAINRPTQRAAFVWQTGPFWYPHCSLKLTNQQHRK